jgi:hypothetical protein
VRRARLAARLGDPRSLAIWRDFRPAAIRAFGLDAGPAVLALATGGPAERAGLRADDILLAFDGRPPPRGAPGRGGSFELMERILAALDEAFADGRATIEVRRGAERLVIEIAAEQGCATRFQLIPGRSLNARADGRYVQLSTAIAEYVADDGELAAVLAHEFAHNVLGHRVRLDEAGVRRGFLGNFGRNARRIRETEIEADRLSVYLMERAGYDPQATVRFWSRFGRRGLNFLGSPTHPNWRRGSRCSRPRSRRSGGRGRRGRTRCRPSRGFRAVLGRQEPALLALEADRGQPAAGEGAGVDADPVGADVDILGDRMAVDDHLAEAVAVAEEIVADPAEVAGRLLLDRDARPEAGMDEQIVADLDPFLEAGEEGA